MATVQVQDAAGRNTDNFWVANSTVSQSERFDGFQSSAGNPVIGQQTLVFSEFEFQVGDLTYTYRGEWTVEIDRGVVFGSVSASGYYNSVEVTRSGAPVATYAGAPIAVDFGERTSIPLVDLAVNLLGGLLLFDSPTSSANPANLYLDSTPGLRDLAYTGYDQLVGGSGADTLRAYGTDDVLDGRQGSDTLTGGLGSDTFRFQQGYGADTVTDFVATGFAPQTVGIDRIDIAAFNTLHTLADVMGLASQVGGDTVLNFGNGDTLTLQGVVATDLRADDFIFAQTGSDFDGDRISDLLWRNANGTVTTWQMDGSQSQPNAFVSTMDPSWTLVDTADFNGDGRSDILWRNADGRLTTWQMDGATANKDVFQASVGTDWRINGTGDFNGDGRDDLLFRNTDGRLTTWQMDGATAEANVFLAAVGNDWHIVGAGDFNGDGNDDLLWRNDNGLVTTWQMHGDAAHQNAFQAHVSSDWHIVGTGDFNGDGRDDILWRNTNGTITTWEMNGSLATMNVFVAEVANTWNISEIEDYNGDGRDDLSWRNQDGTLTTWEMNGATAEANAFRTHVGTDWSAQHNPYDFV